MTSKIEPWNLQGESGGSSKHCRVAELEKEQVFLIAESTELMNIFGAILQKSQ